MATKAKTQKMHLGTITILVKDRVNHSMDVNKILTEHGHMVMARLGVNVQRHCTMNCTALITVAVEGSSGDIKNLTKKINKLYGVVAKGCVVA